LGWKNVWAEKIFGLKNLWAEKIFEKSEKNKEKTVEKERKIEKRELYSAIWSSRTIFKFLGCCHGGDSFVVILKYHSITKATQFPAN
jgi:hypothetical protein